MNQLSTSLVAESKPQQMAAGQSLLPKAPTLDWDNFESAESTALPSLYDMPNKAVTTSGRAALFSALQQIRPAAGSAVLVPSYHCPTMVAPIFEAGLKPVYYPLTAEGLPDLARMDRTVASATQVMFVAHYFGLPLDLQQLLDWCQARHITLVEDCAHSYFGMAGSRPVGQWGHYATASISKFFPVPEAGLLASRGQALSALKLQAPTLLMELKAAWDVVDYATKHGRLAGLRELLRLFRPAATLAPSAILEQPHSSLDVSATYLACDMGRIHQAPTRASAWLHRLLPTGRIVQRRQAIFRQLLEALSNAPGAHPLRDTLPQACAPYVFPLWVDGGARADQVYAQMRSEGMPVFRWDRLWPGTPVDPTDTGSQWSRHLLQVLCHQDLRPKDIQVVAQRLTLALAAVPT